jgi:integrase
MAITEIVKDRKYQVRVAYRDGLGKPKSRDRIIDGTYKDAIIVEQNLLEEIQKGITFNNTFNNLFIAYHESKPNVKPETLRKEVEIFDKFLVDLSRYKVDSITPYQLITLRNKIEAMSGSVTQKNKAIYLIKSIFKFGNKAFGYNDIAQHIEIIKPKVKEKFVYNTITPEQFDLIISYETLDVYKMIYKIYFWAGLRRGEALALFKSDLLQTRELDIYNSISHGNEIGPPKNEQSYRRVGIHEELYKELLPYSKSKGKYLLGNEANLAPNTVNRRFTICQDKANIELLDKGKNTIPHLRIHDLRHSHATFLASQGVPVTAVSHRLGHASISETMNTYLHLFKGDDKRALNAIDDYLKISDPIPQKNSYSASLNDRVKIAISGESLSNIEQSFDEIIKEIKSNIKV